MRLYQVSPIQYSFLHQRPQKLADEMRRKGIPITYIEPGLLKEFLAGRRKGLARNVVVSLGYHVLGLLALFLPILRRKPRRARHYEKPADFEIITMPLIIPHSRANSPFLERLNASVYRQVLRRKVFRKMAPSEVTVALVQNPFFGLVIDPGDFSATFYDCLDEISLCAGRSSPDRFLSYERRLIEQFVRDLHIKTPSIMQTAQLLSGGNQQKVVLAKWLSTRSRVLIFDEPTRGIDVGAKTEVYMLLNRLAEEGKAILFISSELPELFGIADRILVMRRGRLVGNLVTQQSTPEQVMHLAAVDVGARDPKREESALGKPRHASPVPEEKT